MKSFSFQISFKKLLSLLLLSVVMFGITTILSAQTESIAPDVQPCPCSSLYPGYYYTGQYYAYKPVLFTNMPLEQFIGYVMMDSIITYGRDSFSTSQAQENFIRSLTCTGDTLNYALKYLYLLADYNPFLYYNFLTSYQSGKQQPMTLLPELLNHVKKECGLPKYEVIKAEYILHLQTNKLEPFVYESSPPQIDPITGGTYTDSTHLVYAYASVIDTIKGQVLPDINSAINVFIENSEKKINFIKYSC